MKKDKCILAILFITITVVAMLSIGVRFFAKNILVYGYGIDNLFTRIVLHDVEYASLKIQENASVNIDWSEIYPFSNEDLEIDKDYEASHNGILAQYDGTIKSIENKVEEKIPELFPRYQSFVELSSLFEKKIGWKYVGYAEYNGVIALQDNYYIGITSELPLEENARSLKEFSDFCKKQGIDFLYTQEPRKICKFEDENINNSIDFSNKNMDIFLSGIEKEKINIHDYRNDIHNDNLNHHSLFYNTDHHWKSETGFWAAKKLLKTLDEHFDYYIDLEILDENLFEKKTYKNIFLGSLGRKVGLKVAKPDDFTLIYPKFETNIHYEIPDIGLDKNGDFDIMYDKKNFKMGKNKSYYQMDPYAAINYGDHALIKIDNLDNTTGPKILFVHDSFADSEIPFVSLGVDSVDSIDLRHFNGSLKAYITKNKPDIVIVAYSVFTGNIDWQSHSDFYDFR